MGAKCSKTSCKGANCERWECSDPPCCRTSAKNDARVAAILAAAGLVAAIIVGNITDNVDWDGADPEQYVGVWMGFAMCMVGLLAAASSYASSARSKAPDDYQKLLDAATWAPWAALLVWGVTRIGADKSDGRAYDASSAAVYGVLVGTVVMLSTTSAQL